MSDPADRSGLVAEVFLWVAVVVVAIVGVVTVLGDDLLSMPTRGATRSADAGPSEARP